MSNQRILTLILLTAVCLPSFARAQNTAPKKKGLIGVSARVIFNDAGHRSLASFAKHADQVDRVYFKCYRFNESGMPERIPEATSELMDQVKPFAVKNNVEQWLTFDNENEAVTQSGYTWIEKVLDDEKSRAAQIQALVDIAAKEGVKGLQVEYSNLLSKDKLNLTGFIKDLSASCKAHNLLLSVIFEPKSASYGDSETNQAYDYIVLGKNVDNAVLRTDKLHFESTTAGVINSPIDTEVVARYAVTIVDKEKLDIACPVYGFDWVNNSGTCISYEAFMALAKKYNVTPVRDTFYSQNLHFEYKDATGVDHSAWMADTADIEYQCDIVKRYHLHGIAVYDLGREDESFWTALKKANATPEYTASPLPVIDPMAAVGTGRLMPIDLFTDAATPQYYYIAPDSGVAGNDSDARYKIFFTRGKRWADIHFKGAVSSTFLMGWSRTNLLPYYDKGALQFYIRSDDEIDKMTIGFLMAKGSSKDEEVEMWHNLPLSDYVNVTKDWKLVMIPMTNFTKEGYYYDMRNGRNVAGEFKWKQVTKFYIDHAGSAQEKQDFQISGLRVVPSYDPKMLQKLTEKQ